LTVIKTIKRLTLLGHSVVDSGVTNGRQRRQMPPGAAGEGRKTASPKIFYD